MSDGTSHNPLPPDDPALTEEICRLDNEVLAVHFRPYDVPLQTAQVTVLLRAVAQLRVQVRALEERLSGAS